MKKFEVAIVGGGLVGLSAAALLAGSEQRDRLAVRVFDAGRRPSFDAGSEIALRVSALSSGSAGIFALLGAWHRILAGRACPFAGMRVWDAAHTADGPEALHFDAAEFALPELGHIVENVLLQDTLLTCLEQAGVDVVFEKSVSDLCPARNGMEIAFTDGSSVAAQLVVGADGAESRVRRLAQIPVIAWRYPQCAFVTHLSPERPHQHYAWQRFLPDGPLALLPLHDGRVSVVWSTAPSLAEAAMSADDKELGAMLSDASDRVLGELQVAAPRAAFPLRAQYAQSYVQAHVALLGDAAHSIHPLAGQGANLGIADAALLAQVVNDALAAGEYPGDRPVLRRYERARKGANQTMLYFVDTLNRLFSVRSPALAAVRGAGMRAFNRSGPLRRRAVAIALGVGGH